MDMKPQTLSVREMISDKCKQFCQHSTIHGVYYFYGSDHWWLRFIWTCIVTLSLVLCSFLSHMIWSKFVVDPTFTVVESTRYSIENIPFPAVSICNTEMVYQPNTDNITKILRLRTFNETQIDAFYKSFSNIKDKNYTPEGYIKQMHGILEDLGLGYDVLLDLMKKPCDVILKQCAWRSKVNNCADMFRQVFTLVGYCCQFDVRHFRRHVKNDTNFVSGIEVTEALDVTVSGGRSDHGSASAGHLAMYVFEERSAVTLLDSFISVTPATYFDVSLEVWLIDSSSDVKALSLNNRKCILHKDHYMNAKSYQDCMTKLIMKEAVERCRCLPFRYTSNDLTVEIFKPCSWYQLSCIYQALEDVQSDLQSLMSHAECYQKCDYVQYSTEAEYMKQGRDLRNDGGGDSRVTVHFSEDTCMKYRREVLYTWDQMLANLGGIFGLCLGGSIISIIEILWFIMELFYTLAAVGYKKITNRMSQRKRNVKIVKKKHFSTKITPGKSTAHLQYIN